MHNANVLPEDIIKRALNLPEKERAELALRLLESLSPSNERSDDEWRAEIERRAQRVLDGEAVTESWDEVHASIKAELAKK